MIMIEGIRVSGGRGGGEYERRQRLYRVEDVPCARDSLFDEAGIPTAIELRLKLAPEQWDAIARLGRAGTSRLDLAFHPLEIGAHVGRALIAKITVLLERLADDPGSADGRSGLSRAIAGGSRFRIASMIWNCSSSPIV
jgi:hypothetical protein